MIVQVMIDRVADEGENEKELESLPFGCGSTAAQFEYDPKKQSKWEYLYGLQETLFQIMRHELVKAEQFEIAEDKSNEG